MSHKVIYVTFFPPSAWHFVPSRHGGQPDGVLKEYLLLILTGQTTPGARTGTEGLLAVWGAKYPVEEQRACPHLLTQPLGASRVSRLFSAGALYPRTLLRSQQVAGRDGRTRRR